MGLLEENNKDWINKINIGEYITAPLNIDKIPGTN
jgi:hypothetical protein